MTEKNLDNKQICTASFFRLDSTANKWWAFQQMQFGHKKLENIKGLHFKKLFGSGADRGFSPWPNFGTYVLFAAWDSESDAEAFFTSNAFFKKYQAKSAEQFTVYALPAEAHGKWDGIKPFAKEAELQTNKPVMVLTRARIRTSKLLSFWTRVKKVSESLLDYEGALLSIGVGEWPLIQQATISIWSQQSQMLDYAYRNKKHKEVIQLTRKLDWYSEELFARFLPYRFEGQWDGRNMRDFLVSKSA